MEVSVLAGVSTLLGLCAVFGGLYLRLAERRRDRSLTHVLQGEAIAGPAHVIEILKTMQTDTTRIEALQALLAYDHQRAEALLHKVRSTIDLERYAKGENKSRHWLLVLVGVVLLVLASLPVVQTYAKGEDSTFREVTISGRVSGPSGKPVSGATVTVNGYAYVARSDADGRFAGQINDVRRGTLLDVRILQPEIGREQRTVSADGRQLELQVQLQPAAPPSTVYSGAP